MRICVHEVGRTQSRQTDTYTDRHRHAHCVYKFSCACVGVPVYLIDIILYIDHGTTHIQAHLTFKMCV